MARIPPNRRYEALRRSLTWAEPEPIPRPLGPVPQRREMILPSLLELVGGIAGIALGGIGGAALGALLGALWGALSGLILFIGMYVAALVALVTLAMWLLGSRRRSEAAMGGSFLALIGGGFVLYALVRIGERLTRPILPVDLLAAVLAHRVGGMDLMEGASAFRVLRDVMAVMGMVGLAVGSVAGVRWGFRLGHRRPVLTLLALAGMAALGSVMAPLAIGAIAERAPEVSRPHPEAARAPETPSVGGGALEESLSPSPAPSVWVARVRARVRAGPGTTHPILRVLRPGEPVIEQARVRIGEEEWLHVRLSDGTTGWVRSDLLKRP